MHEAKTKCFRAAELRAGEAQAARLRQADALHHEGRDLRRRQAARGLGHAELGLGVGKGDVGDAGQAEAAAQHRPLADRDHHLRRRADLAQHHAEGAVHGDDGIDLARSRRLHATRHHALEVGARAEVAAGAAQHHGPHRGLANGFEYAAYLGQQFRRHRVARFRAVEAQVQHAAVEVQQQVFALG